MEFRNFVGDRQPWSFRKRASQPASLGFRVFEFLEFLEFLKGERLGLFEFSRLASFRLEPLPVSLTTEMDSLSSFLRLHCECEPKHDLTRFVQRKRNLKGHSLSVLDGASEQTSFRVSRFRAFGVFEVFGRLRPSRFRGFELFEVFEF